MVKFILHGTNHYANGWSMRQSLSYLSETAEDAIFTCNKNNPQFEIHSVEIDDTMLYELRDRRYIGGSIGYFKMVTLETFEDRDLAYKECANLRRNDSQSCAHVVEVSV